MKRTSAWYALGLMLMIILTTSACGRLKKDGTVEPPPHPPAAGLSIPAEGSLPTATPSPSSTDEMSLLWWTVPDHAPVTGPSSEAAAILAQQIADFGMQTTDGAIRVVVKKPFGKGGILDFLHTASAAAPSVLPDVVTIHSSELPIAVQSGLIQPLPAELAADLSSDFFPFARSIAEVGGSLYGIAWDADMEHVAFDARTLAATPSRWDEVLESDVRWAIPMGGNEGRVGNSILLQYMSAGGTLSDPVDIAALTRLLQFLDRGRRSGTIPDVALSLPNLDACWQALARGDVNMAEVKASRYLSQRADVPWAQPAASPTWDGTPITIGEGWILAIVTPDPERQRMALEFIRYLTTAERMAAWTAASHYLPARRSAFKFYRAPKEDGYPAFAASLLEAAVALPPGELPATLSRPLQTAVRQVLRGDAIPEEIIANLRVEVGP
ncbi:MAG: hypothetical protein Kow0047_23390 [Anaerolineae bacterium]